MFRLCLVGALGCFLAACASLPANTLALNEIATYKLESVTVSVLPDAHVWWGDAEREVYPKLFALAGAGQGVAGVLVEQFASDNLYDRVIMAYATRYREWLVKS
jgi:hypothetical protein